MDRVLFYKEFGEGPPLVILHGLLGSSDNWLSIAKKLADNRRVFILDQRNHGRSFHHEEFNYEIMADDIHQFVAANGISKPDLIGHSMGGKVAMNYAVKFQQDLNKLVVVDIGPKAYPNHHGHILEGLSAIDLSLIKTRNEADQQLSNWVPALEERQFLLKNLARNDSSHFEWKMNLEVIRREIDQVGKPLHAGSKSDATSLFIYGGNSNYVVPDDIADIKAVFPNASFKRIEGSGHWVHAEQPENFLEAVEIFLSNN